MEIRVILEHTEELEKRNGRICEIIIKCTYEIVIVYVNLNNGCCQLVINHEKTIYKYMKIQDLFSYIRVSLLFLCTSLSRKVTCFGIQSMT